jgi:hypothetical protein
MKKHTNFTNEITGTYYERPTTWTDYLWTALGVLLIIALPFIIADLIWGAEVVTEWVGGLIG